MNPYEFEVTGNRDLIAIFTFIVTNNSIFTANFMPNIYNIIVLSDLPEVGEVSGGDTGIPCNPEGTVITIGVTLTDFCYIFTGWWTPDNILISTDNPCAKGIIGLINLVYNMCRYEQIVRLILLPINKL